jgi:hypothetical protein
MFVVIAKSKNNVAHMYSGKQMDNGMSNRADLVIHSGANSN